MNTVRTLLLCFLAACGAPTVPAHAPLPFAQPLPPLPLANPQPLRAIQVNALIAKEWSSREIAPAIECDNATFLRRVSIDLNGTVPSASEVEQFLASVESDKRAKLVDRLLASPRYAEHFANYWDDVLMGRMVARGQTVDREAFRAWLLAAFKANLPWDRFTRALVSATGQNSTGARSPDAAAAPENLAAVAEVNGAVNWTLRFQDAPQDLAGNTSRIFLGVQLQCAQCHDHKTEPWKMTDFQRFSAATLHFRSESIDRGPMKGVRRVVVSDSARVAARYAKDPDLKAIAQSKAAAFGGEVLEQGEKTRSALAAWMTGSDNAWFAKAFVNRMWGHLVGRGFSDPVDDLRPSNPPEMPQLLEALSAEFVRSGYDVKALLRLMTALTPYHLSAGPPPKSDPDNHVWSRFRLTPLGPDELLNAVFSVTNVDVAATQAGIRNLPQLKMQMGRNFNFLFDVDEESDTKDFEGSISQALTLLNGSLIHTGSRSLEGTSVRTILKMQNGDEAAIQALYMQILARPVRARELLLGLEYLRRPRADAEEPSAIAKPKTALDRLGAKNKTKPDAHTEAFEDLAWALLNSSEFVFNH
jgi:Protein of unknown function (DUF1549)/Protein of unknown function (DUF1553)